MSNRRRLPHPAAHLDGVTLENSCCRTEVVVTRVDGVAGLKMMHDSTCMIFDADPVQQHFARWMCTSAVTSLLGRKTTLGLVIA